MKGLSISRLALEFTRLAATSSGLKRMRAKFVITAPHNNGIVLSGHFKVFMKKSCSHTTLRAPVNIAKQVSVEKNSFDDEHVTITN